MDEQGAAVAAATELRADEQILQIEAAPAEKCREIMEKKRETGVFIAFPRHDYFYGRIGAKQGVRKLVFGRDAKMGEPLEFRQPRIIARTAGMSPGCAGVMRNSFIPQRTVAMVAAC